LPGNPDRAADAGSGSCWRAGQGVHDKGEHDVTELPDWVPEGVDIDVPNSARMYDYMLGGYHNFAVDREYADQMEKLAPGATAIVHANRAFVGRSVRWLVNAGVRQFLDIGSGIPTLGNVHELAQSMAPESRIVYVDIDPVAVAHSKAILAGNPLAGALRADLRHPADILADPEVTGLLDFGQPMAVLFNSMLHFVPDDAELGRILARVLAALAPGSYVTITHGTEVRDWSEAQRGVGELLEDTPTKAFHLRGRDQLLAVLPGMEIVEPGIVPLTDWRPDQQDEAGESTKPAMLALVARKP
jgi:hypothetical protein